MKGLLFPLRGGPFRGCASRRWLSSLVAIVTSLVAAQLLHAVPAAATPALLVVDDDGAQCADADYSAIQPALEDVAVGGTVRVCAGSYDDDLSITKAVTLTAFAPAAPAVDCLTPSEPDPALLSIVDGAIAAAADRVEIDGFVIRNSSIGVTTSEDFSGYRIRRNLIERNSTFGVELESGGSGRTIVEENCIRQNGTEPPRAGLASEFGALRNADIRANTVYANFEGIGIAGPHDHSDIRITKNLVRDEIVSITISGSERSAIVDNVINAVGAEPVTFGHGISVGGGNVGLHIVSNTIENVPGTAIDFSREGFFDVNDAPNADVLVATNVAHHNVTGIRANIPATGKPGNLIDSRIIANEVTATIGSGVIFAPGNDGNTFINNRSVDSGRFGISMSGPVNTRLLGNTATGSGLLDANDLARDRNTWLSTRCVTDNPTGSICR